MARKTTNPTKAAVVRVIVMMFIWIFYLMFALACISYSPADPTSTNPNVAVIQGSPHFHNWCGKFGAFLAFHAMTGIGPGIFVGIVFLGFALFFWTKGEPITQLPLRMI